MTTAMLALFAVVVPLLLAGGQFTPGRAGVVARSLAPWAALPTLVCVLLPLPYAQLRHDWLLMGTEIRLDSTGRIFLILFAILWTVSGVFASSYVNREEQPRFYFFFLLTMAGNLGLPLAADAPAFYLLFALMTFAGYGLVIHRGDSEARRAGRVYIVLAVIGEAFLLSGLVLATSAADSLSIDAIAGGVGADAGMVTACLVIGFGIKAGAVPLHVWLPLAHPVAPTPASAVLSGAMIKAGVLGWIRFLPLGAPGVAEWGSVFLTMGIAAAFFGVAIGMVQTDPKTILAYSSISQMGVMNIGLGIGMASPGAAITAVSAIAIYALHHGLAKGALFLGVGVVGSTRRGTRARALAALGLALPALAIAGAPGTTGNLAKGGLKGLLSSSPPGWAPWIEWVLPLSALATTLLMARFLQAMLRVEGEGEVSARGAWLPWLALLVVIAGGALAIRPLVAGTGAYGGTPLLDLASIGTGALIFWFLWMRVGGKGRTYDPLIAPGDVLIPVERWLATRRVPAPRESKRDRVLAFTSLWYRHYADSRRDDLALRLELRLTRWAPAMLLLILVMAILYTLLARGP